MKRLVILGCVGVAGFWLTGCTISTDIPAFDPVQAQQAELTRSRQSLPMELRSISEAQPSRQPTTRRSLKVESVLETPLPTSQPAPGTVRLTLQEIIQRVARNNGDVRVASYEPAIDATRLLEADARFDPTWYLNYQYQRQDQQTTGTIDAFSNSLTNRFRREDQSDTATTETGIKQLLASGGQAELKYQVIRAQNDPRRFRTSPYYQDELTFQLTQPLLQNFGYEVNHARIAIARNTQKISLLDYRKTLEEQMLEAEKAYWELYSSENDVRIQEALLERTLKTYDVLKKREKNDVTTVQISQAAASVESRRASLVRARATVKDNSDRLKRLMNDPDLPVSAPTTVLSANAPLVDPITFDTHDQIETALLNRLELGQQMLRIDSAGIAAKVARNNELPQVNLQGAIGANGASGAGYERALRNMGEFEFLNWSVGVQIEIPIGNRAARAIMQRALLQRLQATESYQNIVSQVALDVTTGGRDVETSWNEIVASRKARVEAAEALKATQAREDADEPLTYSFVQLKLDQQERLAQAEQAESLAISRYNFALVKLEKAKGTILRYNNIVLEEENSPFSSRGKLKPVIK